MLVDELVHAGAMGYDPKRMAHTLRCVANAQKYVLDPAFAATADALSTDYGSLVRAFPFCRLPFAETWIEVAQADRPQFMAAGIHAPQFQVRPRRVGFLCSATRADLSAWKAHLFWVSELGCNPAGMAMHFDMTHADDVYCKGRDLRPIGTTNPEIFPNMITVHPGWAAADEGVRQALQRHTRPDLADYGTPELPDEIDLMSKAAQDKLFSVLFDLARSDWAGEVAFLLATIGLLNARNAVERERVDVTRKNKGRVRSGKPLFFEHHLLKIHRLQHKRAAAATAGTGHSHEPLRMHICAGHWKVRRTGIFFWRPFWRGNPARGVITKDYEVVE